ncbi:hypothetical protein AB0465_11440 [Streptomyces griseoviridis]|uniref:hypothetical protein n=1 Tax=Streptomyces griseoviridis TaxID=45398 RepID=UPI00344B8C02
MNGPEHFREAERLLSEASFTDVTGAPVTREGILRRPDERDALIARAAVHATLARTAVAEKSADDDRARSLAEQITALGKARGWSTWAADYIHPDREFVDTFVDTSTMKEN